MTDFYTALCASEKRSPNEREQAHFQALPQQLTHARQATAAFAEILQGVDTLAVTSRATLAQLPVTRKTELLDRLCHDFG
jgi:phenylacetate-CoA ligase